MRFRNPSDGTYDTLKTSDGRETGALYGGINTFFSYVSEYQPTHVLWTFDHGRSSYRTEIRSNYKANRGPKDYDLSPQFTAFDRFLSLIDVRHYREQNVEADDLMAAAAIKWQEEMPVVIVSADHDIRQLVSKRVRVVKPSMGLSKNSAEKVFDWNSTLEYYGLLPEQLPELWALTGDGGDNIDGIRGIGPKTAAKMLAEWGDLESVLLHHPKVQGYEQQVRENYRMIRLDGKCAEFNVRLEDCLFDPNLDDPELTSFFEEFEMKSLVEKQQKGLLV
jgi:DNA polymerase-1